MSQKKIDVFYMLFIVSICLMSSLVIFLILMTLGFTGITMEQWIGAVILCFIGAIIITIIFEPLRKRFTDEKDS